MFVTISDTLAHEDRPVTAESCTTPGAVSLNFRRGTEVFSLQLPDKMAACVAMIAEAFNAHRTGDPVHHSAAAVAAMTVAVVTPLPGVAQRFPLNGTRPLLSEEQTRSLEAETAPTLKMTERAVIGQYLSRVGMQLRLRRAGDALEGIAGETLEVGDEVTIDALGHVHKVAPDAA